MIISTIISTQMGYYLYIVLALKIMVIVYHLKAQLFYTKIDNYRSIGVQTLHIILMIFFTINT
jgi:hypothetical protein